MDIVELNNKLKSLQDYAGVFTYDNIPTSLDYKVYVILYIRKNEQHMGHYCVMDRRKNVFKGLDNPDVFYFDSFGMKPDFVRQLYFKLWDTPPKPPNNVITKLLSKYKYDYNNYDYQSIKSNTCGDWAIFYCLNPDMNKDIWKMYRSLPQIENDKILIEIIKKKKI